MNILKYVLKAGRTILQLIYIFNGDVNNCYRNNMKQQIRREG